MLGHAILVGASWGFPCCMIRQRIMIMRKHMIVIMIVVVNDDNDKTNETEPLWPSIKKGMRFAELNLGKLSQLFLFLNLKQLRHLMWWLNHWWHHLDVIARSFCPEGKGWLILVDSYCGKCVFMDFHPGKNPLWQRNQSKGTVIAIGLIWLWVNFE